MAVTRTGGPAAPAPDDRAADAGAPLGAAQDLCHRAPELAVLFAERALEQAQDVATALRAGHLLGAALNDCGRGPEAARRLVALVADAEPHGGDPDLHPVRIEIARSCLAVGAPSTALAALRPVLDADDVGPALRADALVRAAGALGRVGRADAVPAALAGADLVQRDDPGLAPDAARSLRADARAVAAADARRRGSPREAEQLARGGLGLLTGLADPERGRGRLGAALLLELVQSLLDRGAAPAAVSAAEAALDRPVRAATCDALAWVRIALARRVHLAEGDTAPALLLLGDAAAAARRHGLDGVLAPALDALSHVHEARGDLAAALRDLRDAHAADRRSAAAVAAARTLLVERFGPERPRAGEVADRVAELVLARAARGRSGAALDRESYRQHLDLVLAGPDQPVAHVVVRAGGRAGAGADPAELAAVAGAVRAAAPQGAVLGRLGATAVAALLPGFDRDAAQRWVDAAVGDGPGVLVGVAQHRAGSTADQLLAAAERAARPATTSAAGGTAPAPLGPAPTGTVGPDHDDGRRDAPSVDAATPQRADEPEAPDGGAAAAAPPPTPERGLRVVAPWRDDDLGRGPHGGGWPEEPVRREPDRHATAAPADDLAPDVSDPATGAGWTAERADEAGEVPALAALPAAAVTDPAVTDPAVTDPAVTDPALTDPALTDPAAPEPSGAGPEPRPARPGLVLAPPPTAGPEQPAEASVPRSARRGEHRTPVTAFLAQDALARPRTGRRRSGQDRPERPDEPDHRGPDREPNDREPDRPGLGDGPAGASGDTGPPPAPSPRELHGPAGRARREQGDGGLGDLLAEALAAFEEGRRPPVGPRAAGPGTTGRGAAAVPDRDGEPGRPAGTGRGEPPVWLPDADGPDGRRSSAGE